MANYLPLKNYMMFCVDKVVDQYGCQEPFLDAGCGIGDISEHLVERGWSGKAIDFSDVAVGKAKARLSHFGNITVEKKSLFEETGKYKTILLMDVIEHIEDDQAFLNKIYDLLEVGGHLIITTPSNPREWRWDDEVYGHFRRYTEQDMKSKLGKAGLKAEVLWDVTFPVFWLMRRVYTRFLKNPNNTESEDKISRTKESASTNAWEEGNGFIGFFDNWTFFWNLIYKISFALFRNKLTWGHEFIVLAKKDPK